MGHRRQQGPEAQPPVTGVGVKLSEAESFFSLSGKLCPPFPLGLSNFCHRRESKTHWSALFTKNGAVDITECAKIPE